jgi:hypothetical protein
MVAQGKRRKSDGPMIAPEVNGRFRRRSRRISRVTLNRHVRFGGIPGLEWSPRLRTLKTAINFTW